MNPGFVVAATPISMSASASFSPSHRTTLSAARNEDRTVNRFDLIDIRLP
jgi:hypothetical protein